MRTAIARLTAVALLAAAGASVLVAQEDGADPDWCYGKRADAAKCAAIPDYPNVENTAPLS